MLPELYPQQWVILAACLATLVPIGIGWYRYRVLQPALRSIFWLCVISFFLDGAARVFWVLKMPNLWLGHLNTLIEFLLIANAYRLVLNGNPSLGFMRWLMIGFTVLAVGNSMILQDLYQFNTYIKVVEAILLISLSLSFFYQLLKQLTVHRLERLPFFWINSAVLLYFSSSLFVFIYSNYILFYSYELGITIWFIHALFFILFNLILALGLWISPKNSNSPG